MTEIMKEWDMDGGGIVLDWEMKGAFNFKLLDIPEYQHDLLQNALKQGADGDLSVSVLVDAIQELHFDTNEAEQSPTYQSIKAENGLESKLTFGFISKEEFANMSDLGYFKTPLTEQSTATSLTRPIFFDWVD